MNNVIFGVFIVAPLIYKLPIIEQFGCQQISNKKPDFTNENSENRVRNLGSLSIPVLLSKRDVYTQEHSE
jgi:hypothetical protein